jgi:hypothetical protein
LVPSNFLSANMFQDREIILPLTQDFDFCFVIYF